MKEKKTFSEYMKWTLVDAYWDGVEIKDDNDNIFKLTYEGLRDKVEQYNKMIKEEL